MLVNFDALSQCFLPVTVADQWMQQTVTSLCSSRRVGQPLDGGAQLAKASPPQQLQTRDSAGAAGSSFIAAASPAMRTRQVSLA
jgi:hypothetical protein